MNRTRLRTFAVWLLLIGVGIGVFVLRGSGEPALPEVDATVLRDDLADRGVDQVFVVDGDMHVYRTDGEAYRIAQPTPELWSLLALQGVPVSAEEADDPLVDVLWVAVPVVLLVLLLVWFLRRQQGGPGGVLALRKSRARLLSTDAPVRFDDVGGAEEAKARLGDVIDYLRSPARWSEAGVRLPRGVLLEGPPGCGKTLLARAVAGEAGVPVYVVSASEFVEMFVGVGAARVRDMFEEAQKKAPAVIFIDEIDAVGRRRGAGISTAHDEREQTLNQLLVSLDGIEKAQGTKSHVVVIGATNRVDILDRALLRPGRFDLRLTIAPPEQEARLEILRIHTQDKRLDTSVDLAALARRTAGRTGADLESLCNESAMRAVRRSIDGGGPATVREEDFEAALSRGEDAAAIFDQLDALLVDSASQLSKADGEVRVRLRLADQEELEGLLVWADAGWLKLRTSDGTGRLVPKHQVRWVEAGEGTAPADADAVLRSGRTVAPGVA